MKDIRNDVKKQGNHQGNNVPKPEIRDNLDSRENLEINDTKSGHNKKEVHDGEKTEQNDKRGSKQGK